MVGRKFAIAALVGGLLWPLPDVLTNVWRAEEGTGAGHAIVSVPLYAAYVLLSFVAALCLALASRGVRAMLPPGRLATVGAGLLSAGFLLVAANAALALALALRGGVLDIFLLFGLGFLALLAGHSVVAIAAWRGGRSWPLPTLALVAAAAIPLVLAPGALHMVGLIAFGLAWTLAGFLLAARPASAARRDAAPPPRP